MNKNENTGLYVTFNRLLKELKLFENRFFAVTANRFKSKEYMDEMSKRSKAELYFYYKNLLDYVNDKLDKIETEMLQSFPEDMEETNIPQSIMVRVLKKKLVYYPENKCFMDEEMSIEDINVEDTFLKKVEGN